MASKTNVEALKKLCAAMIGGGKTAADIPGNTSAEVIDRITAIYTGENLDGELGTLTLSSVPGSTVGTTAITVEGASEGATFKWQVGETLPACGEDLSSWTDWDGSSDITVDDSTTICICEVDENNAAISGGTVLVSGNIG